jgi:reductive dehalogenase
MKKLSKPRYRIAGDMTRFDERENVHARYELEPGTPEWETFYQKHPEWEKVDLETKALPGIGKVGHAWDLPMFGGLAKNITMLGREDMVDGPVSPVKSEMDPARAAEKIKGLARHLGADLVRIGPLNQAHVYSHVGKTKQCPDKRRGEPISLPHKHAIAIAVGTNADLLKTGPVLSMFIEVQRAYAILAKIAVVVAGYIRGLGYPARAHNLRNYLVLCAPIAIDAGMGELSRMGTMITKELGPALKISVVTTDLPLPHDPPVDIGVDEFCRDCKICAESCPSGAIPYGDKVVDRGVEKWRIKPEACYKIWCESGTDCGVCIASCPWTKPRTAFHNLCKEIATRKNKAGLWMSWGEKLFYGKYKPKRGPDWLEVPDLSILKKYKKLR